MQRREEEPAFNTGEQQLRCMKVLNILSYLKRNNAVNACVYHLGYFTFLLLSNEENCKDVGSNKNGCFTTVTPSIVIFHVTQFSPPPLPHLHDK